MKTQMNDDMEIKIKKIHLYYCPTDKLKRIYRFAVASPNSENIVFLFDGSIHKKQDVMAITPKIICQFDQDRIFRDNNLMDFIMADHAFNNQSLVTMKSVIRGLVNFDTMTVADLLKVEDMMIDTQNLMKAQKRKQNSFLSL